MRTEELIADYFISIAAAKRIVAEGRVRHVAITRGASNKAIEILDFNQITHARIINYQHVARVGEKPLKLVKKLIEFKIADIVPTQQVETWGRDRQKRKTDVYALDPQLRIEIVELLRTLLVAIIAEMVLGIKLAVLCGKPITPFQEQANFVMEICTQFAKCILDKRTAYFSIE